MKRKLKKAPARDSVNSPSHYRAHPSGVEAITITEHFNFCVGNAIKYLWRAGLKATDPTEDYRKAVWYIEREIARIKTPDRRRRRRRLRLRLRK